MRATISSALEHVTVPSSDWATYVASSARRDLACSQSPARRLRSQVSTTDSGSASTPESLRRRARPQGRVHAFELLGYRIDRRRAVVELPGLRSVLEPAAAIGELVR